MVNTDIDQNPIDNLVPLVNHPFVKLSRRCEVFLPNWVILLNGSLEELLPFCGSISGLIFPQKYGRRG